MTPEMIPSVQTKGFLMGSLTESGTVADDFVFHERLGSCLVFCSRRMEYELFGCAVRMSLGWLTSDGTIDPLKSTDFGDRESAEEAVCLYKLKMAGANNG